MSGLEQHLAAVTGEGQALAYFVAFLKRMLPTLADDIERWCADYEIGFTETSDKFYIVVPQSGTCPQNFKDCDPQIQSSSNTIGDIHSPRAGDQSRKLTRSMHQIQDTDKKVYYFCGEFAGPVKTLQDIFNLVEPTEEVTQQFKDQVNKFASLLEQLAKFEQTKAYANKFVIFRFNDEEAGQKLSELLLQKIKANIAERGK